MTRRLLLGLTATVLVAGSFASVAQADQPTAGSTPKGKPHTLCLETAPNEGYCITQWLPF